MNELSAFWDEIFEKVRCSTLTAAYLKQVFENPVQLNDGSIVIEFARARETFDFQSFQRIGDWSMVALSMHFDKPHAAVIEFTGRKCYLLCDQITASSWDVYPELANNIDLISWDIRHALRQAKTPIIG